MSITLPKGETNSGKAEWSHVYSNDKALKEAAETLETKVASLEAAPSSITWYTPKVIATEQTRESASFGFLTTEDKIPSVVVPENGVLVVGYQALVKSSVSAAGRAAIFIGANQLRRGGVAQEENTESTAFHRMVATATGMASFASGPGEAAFGTTGEVLASSSNLGGPCFIGSLAAGTYTVGVEYKATSGSVTAKSRTLWVGVLG